MNFHCIERDVNDGERELFFFYCEDVAVVSQVGKEESLLQGFTPHRKTSGIKGRK